MSNHDRRVDAYVAKSAEFAQPILEHLREVTHKAVPDIEETIKWSMPFFTVNGIFLCHIAAFKAHCAFGLWGEQLTAKLKAEGVATGERSMGSLGRITSLKELPKDKDLIAYIRAGAAEIASGQRTVSYKRPARKLAKPEAKIPVEFAAALKKSKAAQKIFDGFSPSARREYLEWVGEAKREETRLSRAAQAAEWIAEGKSRYWKYERK